MKRFLSTERCGALEALEANGVRVPFRAGPAFFTVEDRVQRPVPLEKSESGFSGTVGDVGFSLSYLDEQDHLSIVAEIDNRGSADFSPEAVGLKLGVDSYMTGYPQWNEKFFPTFLRCERTHFWGYFMSPLGQLVAVTCDTPVAAWSLDYNALGANEDTDDFGHRIHTANLLLLCRGPLPTRHPQSLAALRAGESKRFVVKLTPLPSLDDFRGTVAEKLGLPVIDFDRYTLSKGETARAQVLCAEPFQMETVSPSGRVFLGESIPMEEYGAYAVTLTTAGGKVAEAALYCRHPYAWYLDRARENAVTKPQKASTHTESWYGFFSAFLAKKHHPLPALDARAQMNFDETMPLMFDFERGKALVIPNRIQNIACLIGLLADVYEAQPDPIWLDRANKMADELLRHQGPDGAFYSGKGHYTAVIYIAKSMLELALCEKRLADDPVFFARYQTHYASAKRAVDNLRAMLETIGTEGEHTLEDGMISCSALQIGFFALTLPEGERAPYIRAAEHMLSLHRCLEQQIVPDCRMRGATLRFWEAQYDVMIRANLLSSPHGWTSWKTYATYYLYLLTGKEAYLRDTMDTLGACLQTVSEAGELRWAFAVDPYLNAKVFARDERRQSPDGYESARFLPEKAYRGKYERKIFGEQYIDMVSGWYRASPAAPMMGGYELCPLILDGRVEQVDPQGGACDNDVHEHFKCLEETALKKAFVLIRPDRSVLAWQCRADFDIAGALRVTLLEKCDFLHVNTPCAICVTVDGGHFHVPNGMTLLDISGRA